MVSMKKLTILTLAVLGIISLFSMKSFAQRSGVVDGNKVLESYSEYAAANTKLQGIIKSWQDTLGMMQKAAKGQIRQLFQIPRDDVHRTLWQGR